MDKINVGCKGRTSVTMEGEEEETETKSEVKEGVR